MADETIAGVHPVHEAVVSNRRAIERIHVVRGAVSERIQRIIEVAGERGIPVRRETRAVLNRLAPGTAHQGVVAVAGVRSYSSVEALVGGAIGASTPALVVVLDEVQDPHNLGAVIRTAETAGASGVIVTLRRSAPLSGVVSRASAGALEHLPVARATNLVDTIKYLKINGIWVIGFDPVGSVEWTDFDFREPVALVLGGEHKGIRPLVARHCDAIVRFPVLGKVASLNVSVSAGIALYEVVRQRRAGRHPDGR